MSAPAQATTTKASGHLPLLSVVVPCYNESEVIGAFYRALKPALEGIAQLDHEIVFVDDGSVDDTLDQLWDPLESTCRHASLSIL